MGKPYSSRPAELLDRDRHGPSYTDLLQAIHDLTGESLEWQRQLIDLQAHYENLKASLERCERSRFQLRTRLTAAELEAAIATERAAHLRDVIAQHRKTA